MVGSIVLAASAGIGALAGLAAADRFSPTGKLPLAAVGPSCATCGGTGKVACRLCSRWSDGDVGCRPCAGTGRQACRSCRGSGTGRKAFVAVRAQARRPLVARQMLHDGSKTTECSAVKVQ
ncbi:hypothetical protein EJB05_37419, partial [Eragrostis curvula]